MAMQIGNSATASRGTFPPARRMQRLCRMRGWRRYAASSVLGLSRQRKADAEGDRGLPDEIQQPLVEDLALAHIEEQPRDGAHDAGHADTPRSAQFGREKGATQVRQPGTDHTGTQAGDHEVSVLI